MTSNTVSDAIPSHAPSALDMLKRRATLAAVIVAFVLIVIKTIAWSYTGSVAMLASLIDSALDLFASGLNLFAVRHAMTPADAEHRFGHGKAEALAGLGQAAFITGSGVFLLFESLSQLIRPEPLAATWLGIGVILISLVLTTALVWYQRLVLARGRSVAIEADSLHYVGDIASNLGVLLALILAGLIGWTFVDPLAGLSIAALILWGAIRIFLSAYDELMDRELSPTERAQIKAIAIAHSEVRSIHDLRTRRAGHSTFIQLHLELPPDMTLLRAHVISDAVEAGIKRAFPLAEVLIHQDPEGIEEERSKVTD